MLVRLALLGCVALNLSCSARRTTNDKIPPDYLTKKEQKQDQKNHLCTNTGKYSVDERRALYPYNTAVKIFLVSFDTLEGDYFTHSLPITNNEIDFSKISETEELSRSEIDSLTDMLLNLGYSGRIFTNSSTGCYDPQNAVLFADTNGKIFEYIEICFHCFRNRISSDKVRVWRTLQWKI